MVLAGVLAVAGLAAVEITSPTPAAACNPAFEDCGSTGAPDSGTPVVESSPSEPAPPPVSCTVYANGTGMGSYCRQIGAGGGTSKTLRERFGGQSLQRCRYEQVPEGVPVPFNARPDEGRYLLMSCLENIDLDTYDGGPDRSVQMSVVFVPHGRDISDRNNAITDFLWTEVTSAANQMPVPVLVTQPNPVPIVGSPTYFTFRWLDPQTKQVVAQGPYGDRPGGGPFRQVRVRGGDLVMRAEATRLVIDPNQEGIDPVVCDPSTPYQEGAAPADQPEDACKITFPRSSASAEELATAPIPEHVEDAFYASVQVQWRVTYGQPGDMRQLGDGFTMGVGQVIPVQEVQAPNQPPTVIY